MNDLFFRRLSAQFVDLVIYIFLSLITSIVLILIVGVFAMAITSNNPRIVPTLTAIAGWVGFFGGYFFWNYKHLKDTHATLGYRIMKLKFQTAVNTRNYIVRTITKMIFAFLLVGGLGLIGILHIIILINTKGQRDLVDYFGGTKVTE